MSVSCQRILPAGFIEPCIPTVARVPPSGPGWLHEIKHDGYRLVGRLEGRRVRLFTRRGNDWSDRFPRIGEALASLKATSATIDGEAVVLCPKTGLSLFDELHSGRRDRDVILYAFDLIELICAASRLRCVRPPDLAADQDSRGHPHQRAYRSRWRDRIPPCLQARMRGHRVEAARFTLSLGSCADLD